MNKRRAFLENAGLLWERWGIESLLYGSLGLEQLTGEELNADDVDVLIPRAFLQERWAEFRAALEENGYALLDEREHEFEKDGVRYAYAQIEELEPFAGIDLAEIETIRGEGCPYKRLSLSQYLRVYTASARDGYRIAVREKKDAEKIALIRRKLLEETGAVYESLEKKQEQPTGALSQEALPAKSG